MIKTILWDIDGTILDFIYSEHYALKKTFALYGVDLTDKDIELYSKINDSYWTKFDNGEISKNDIYKNRFRDLMAALGLSQDKIPDIMEMNDIYQESLGEVFKFIENAEEIVRNLRGFCRQYVVTNGSTAAQVGRLTLSGLDKIMDGIFISEQLGTQKPNKEFFDLCGERIPGFNKNETMIIGDSLTSDIQGGNNAGILTCWYNPHKKVSNKNVKIDYDISNLEEVYDIVGYKK